MADRLVGSPPVQPAAVWQALDAQLGGRLGALPAEATTAPGGPSAAGGPEQFGSAVGQPLTVLDVGGGTGGFAVPLARLGHQVTVVDPSPDSLAALQRRASDVGVSGSIVARQGDATDLVAVAGRDSYDLVVCHSVLELVDDPAAALAGLAAVLRPGGVLSLLAATRGAAVFARVLAGRVADALALLDDPAGHDGPTDPLARRFDAAGLRALLAAAGLRCLAVHGIRVFTDLVPAGTVDIAPDVAALLARLEQRVADDPGYQTLAVQLHAVAERPS
jgi:S-adenosylmethionine-dependent methyltransferase